MKLSARNRLITVVKTALLLGSLAGCYGLYQSFSNYVSDSSVLLAAAEKTRSLNYMLELKRPHVRGNDNMLFLPAYDELEREITPRMVLPANAAHMRDIAAKYYDLLPLAKELRSLKGEERTAAVRETQRALFEIESLLLKALRETNILRNRLLVFTGVLYFSAFLLLILLEAAQYLLITDDLLAGLAMLRRKILRRAAPFPGIPEAENEMQELSDGADALRCELRLLSEERQRLKKEADVRQWRMRIQSRSLEVTRKKIVALLDDLEKTRSDLQVEQDALKEAKNKLERSNKELEQFAYVASHDLKEPLRIVSSFSGLLAKRYGDKLGPDAEDFIRFITQGATRASELITSLFNYSKVTYNTRDFKPLPAEDLLQKAIFNLKMTIEEKGARITYSQLPYIYGDEFQLVQLFQNLISNALKFTSDKAPAITISATEEDGFSNISFADNGIGIAPEHFDRIFLIFQRLHSQEKYPGTGIGLAICKKITENHGGSISVESTPGEGCSFSLRFPVREGLAGSEENEEREENKAEKATT